MKETLKKKEKRLRRKRIAMFVALSVVALLFLLSVAGILRKDRLPKDGASFLFLSVGQASCSLIFTEEGTVMIDTGSNLSEGTLGAALSHYRISELSMLILTHADEDHAGGLDLVLEEAHVRKLVMNEITLETLTGYARDTLDRAVSEGKTELLTVTGGDVLSHGESTIRFLAPNRDHESDDANESSLVFLFRYRETSALYTGDADTSGEAEALRLLRAEEDFSCDVLLVGHHGSNTSSSEAFISFVKPQYAVISCALENRYGHPSITVLDRLNSVGATILRTDLDGSILLHSDGSIVTPLR